MWLLCLAFFSLGPRDLSERADSLLLPPQYIIFHSSPTPSRSCWKFAEIDFGFCVELDALSDDGAKQFSEKNLGNFLFTAEIFPSIAPLWCRLDLSPRFFFPSTDVFQLFATRHLYFNMWFISDGRNVFTQFLGAGVSGLRGLKWFIGEKVLGTEARYATWDAETLRRSTWRRFSERGPLRDFSGWSSTTLCVTMYSFSSCLDTWSLNLSRVHCLLCWGLFQQANLHAYCLLSFDLTASRRRHKPN